MSLILKRVHNDIDQCTTYMYIHSAYIYIYTMHKKHNSAQYVCPFQVYVLTSSSLHEGCVSCEVVSSSRPCNSSVACFTPLMQRSRGYTAGSAWEEHGARLSQSHTSIHFSVVYVDCMHVYAACMYMLHACTFIRTLYLLIGIVEIIQFRVSEFASFGVH